MKFLGTERNRANYGTFDSSSSSSSERDGFCIPQRYIFGIMGFLAVVNAYTLRVCLNVAINEMVYPIHDSKNNTDPDACPADGNSSSEVNGGKLHWSEETQGIILGSFFWGYVITHLPGGVIAEKFGGKYTLSLGILSTAVLSLLTPVVVESGGWQGLTALRIIEGIGEGTTYPALNVLLARWVPLSERAQMGTLVYAGGQIGTVVGSMLSGFLIEATGSWQSVFYVFGSVAVLWFIIFSLICYSDPQSHPFISDEELQYLEKELGGKRQAKDVVIPWKAILTSVPLWALVCAQIGHDWGFFTMVTDLPKYMKNVLRFDIMANGIWSSLPYIVMWIVSMASGWFCDFLVTKNYFTINFARKFFTSVASAGPAVFIMVASYSGCDRALVIAMFTIGMGFMGTFYPGMKVNALDLSPNFAGVLMAITNGIGAFSGIITPYLVGVVAPNQTLVEWRIVFWISFVVFMVTNVIFVVFGSTEVQEWDAIKPNVSTLEKAYHSDNGNDGKEADQPTEGKSG